MATEVIPMSVKATAAAYALEETARAAINVTAVCRDEGVSRAVFYKYVDRVRREGLDGLEERSRRPHTSPQRTPVQVEDWIVRRRCRRWRRSTGSLSAEAWSILSPGSVPRPRVDGSRRQRRMRSGRSTTPTG